MWQNIEKARAEEAAKRDSEQEVDESATNILKDAVKSTYKKMGPN